MEFLGSGISSQLASLSKKLVPVTTSDRRLTVESLIRDPLRYIGTTSLQRTLVAAPC